MLKIIKPRHFGQTYGDSEMIVGSIKSSEPYQLSPKYLRITGDLIYISRYPTHQVTSSSSQGTWKKVYRYDFIMKYNPKTRHYSDYRPLTNKMERDTFGDPIENAKKLILEATRIFLD